MDKVTKAKYYGVEITKDLHWDEFIQGTAAEADKTSAFMNHNLQGSLVTIQTNCYKGVVLPIMGHAAVMCYPDRQYHV